MTWLSLFERWLPVLVFQGNVWFPAAVLFTVIIVIILVVVLPLCLSWCHVTWLFDPAPTPVSGRSVIVATVPDTNYIFLASVVGPARRCDEWWIAAQEAVENSNDYAACRCLSASNGTNWFGEDPPRGHRSPRPPVFPRGHFLRGRRPL